MRSVSFKFQVIQYYALYMPLLYCFMLFYFGIVPVIENVTTSTPDWPTNTSIVVSWKVGAGYDI